MSADAKPVTVTVRIGDERWIWAGPYAGKISPALVKHFLGWAAQHIEDESEEA